MQSLLSGVRVLDLSRMLAGPFGSVMLSDLGAEIIKIEDPGYGDPTRYFLEQGELNGQAGYFLSTNRGKKSITLDLRKPKGREVFYELVKKSDVVWNNYRPSVLKRYQIDYETLKTIKPDIICCSISGFGKTALNPDRPSFDLTLQALGGTMSITGEPDRPPVRMGVPLGDIAGGMYAAYAVAAALFHRSTTGEGQEIDIGLLDCQIAMLSYVGQLYLINGQVPQQLGSGHQIVVPYQAIKTRDSYVVVAAYEEKFFAGICKAIGRDELIDDPRFKTNTNRRNNKETLIAILEAEFQKWTVESLLQQLEKNDVPCAPVNRLDKALSQPNILARNMVVEIEHPTAGRYKAIGNPIKLSSVKEEEFAPSPLLGQHTEEILSQMLGYSTERIAQLREEKLI